MYGRPTRASAARSRPTSRAATSTRRAEHDELARSRAAEPRRPASRYTSPKPGSTRNACSILARNPKPTSATGEHEPPWCRPLERAGHRVRGADEQEHEQRVGVVEPEHQRGDRRERERPHRRSARPPGENQRFTVGVSTPTAATPSSACGTRMLHEFTPKMRAPRSPSTQSDAGVLSTVMKFDASDEPKKNAFQLFVAGLHRGRVVRVRPARRAEAPEVEDRGRRGAGRGARARAHAGSASGPRQSRRRPRCAAAPGGPQPRRRRCAGARTGAGLGRRGGSGWC